MTFLQGFDIAWKSVAVGYVLYPVSMYVFSKFGSVLVQDVKQVAYKAWDFLKSKV